MKEEQSSKEHLPKLLNGLQCPKDFLCYTSGLEKLCRAEDIGLETFLVCLEKNPPDCRFTVEFGDMYFCQCPLRVYIARKLNK